MTFAIAGVSGNTGKVVADALLARGEKVRVIVRDVAKGGSWKERGAEVAVADVADTGALTRALRGAAGAYLLVPPNLTEPSYRDYQSRVVRSMAAAVSEAGVSRVVLLSSLGAEHESGTGPIAALHVAETLLGQVRGVAVSSLRAGYFFENLAPSLGQVKESGVLPSFFPARFAFAMTGTRDIGRLATELLVDRSAKSGVVELGTLHSHEEIAKTLSKLLSKDVRVQEAPLEAMVPTLTSFGFSPDRAELYAELTSAIIDGRVGFQPGHRRVGNTEPLEEVFRGLLAG